MGDQIGVAVSGTLYYVPLKEFQRIRALPVPNVQGAALFAALSRINTLYMIARAGSGHIGSSFSSMDIMSWLQCYAVRTPPAGDATAPRDLFFSSKGHDAPGFYSAMIGLGKLEFDLIHKLRRLGGLPGHPDVATPNIVTNTGSLGMGVSKAKGMIFANRLNKRPGNVYVLTGDGELQEGQFWESLVSAANHKLHELTVIVDHNKLQSDTLVAKVSDLGDLEAKFAAFGWHVSRCDGNDIPALVKALEAGQLVLDKPKVIIADTIKGKGVSFMEHTSIDSDVEFYKFHSGAPTDDAYVRAAQELINSANVRLATVGSQPLELETVVRSAAVVADNLQRSIPAYTEALLEQARENSKLVALDADLILDTGLIPYQKEFPDRFVECGIAEQDMVSQAGAMALGGLIPVVHSFSCFLTTRPAEQIYNNCTEGTKVIYVGSLSGVLPAGPGHSHQSVRDVTMMSALPGLVVIEPLCAAQIGPALRWAVNSHDRSSYLRLTSIPYTLRSELAVLTSLSHGQGHMMRQGGHAVIVVSSPVMTVEALKATDLLESEGIEVTVIGMPWLNRFDASWFAQVMPRGVPLLTIENHYADCGFGTQFVAAMTESGLLDDRSVRRLGLERIPASGLNDEVLKHHRMDADSIAARIREAL